QNLSNASNDCFPDTIWIAKTDLAFGRVDIHIDCTGVEIEKKKGNGILPFHERSVITLAHRVCDERAFNRAPVHEDELLAARLPAQTGLADQAADSQLFPGRTIYFKQPLQQIRAV